MLISKKFFKFSVLRLRDHLLKLSMLSCRLDCKKFAFSSRSVDMWNGLDEDIIACNLEISWIN